MPRAPSISQADVDAICDRLLAQDKSPTLRLIIAEHGSGSQTTVQPLYKDWKRRRDASRPAEPDNSLSPDLLKSLNKHFTHDIQVATAALRDQLDTSEEANGDLVRENALTLAMLRESEAELAALSEQDAVIRGQAAQLETDLEQLRKAFEAERHARLDAERREAVAGAQRDVMAEQLADLTHRMATVQESLTAGLAREQQLSIECSTAKATTAALQDRADRLERDLAAARQAEKAAHEHAAELRGQLKAR